MHFLGLLCGAVVFMALATPLSAALADRFGRRPVLLVSAVLAIAVGLAMPALLSRGDGRRLRLPCAGAGRDGAHLRAARRAVAELFPVPVRYTGAASAYNLGGILGASFAPSLAQILEASGGVAWVGYYIAVAGVISFLAVFSMRETRGLGVSAGGTCPAAAILLPAAPSRKTWENARSPAGAHRSHHELQPGVVFGAT